VQAARLYNFWRGGWKFGKLTMTLVVSMLSNILLEFAPIHSAPKYKPLQGLDFYVSLLLISLTI
jgi:hypothetical protein